MTRYRWVASRKAEGFPTAVSCRIAGVGRQAFYDWSDRQERGSSLKELATAELVDEIRRIHSDSGGAYGSPRVTAVLRRQGRRVNHKRVERLMRVNGICGIYKRRKPRFRPAAGVCSTPDDLVRRDFGPGRPDIVWAGDITYIATGQGWLHLAVVLDIGSRRVIGYSMAADMPARLVIDALNTAAASRGGRTTGVIFHSDRGSQGGFNRWLQHLDVEVCDGQAVGVVGDADGETGDEVAGASADSSGCGAGVLGEDRRGAHKRGRGDRVWGVGFRRIALVPRTWGNANSRAGSVYGALPVLQ